ncbi:MAG TPA: class I SAM-dependent methyltransferase [Longimicrobium sp.]|jgi:SAM-dependent methyltransferase|uniref:class I SAM-dependent methyltransferase n=1 Tax=Longimicrobium sp. TaxID=2029185 RepID=UPI002ED7C75E
MRATSSEIQEDFDRLAAFDDGRWDHNRHYHPFLLRQLPQSRDVALEVGCGTGAFARALAAYFRRVVAVDLSPEMLRHARNRSQGIQNLEYHQADLRSFGFPAESFDCIAAIATLHHVPLGEAWAKLRAALRPGGVLLLLDLYRPSTLSDWLLSGVAVPANLLLRRRNLGTWRQSPEVRRAWAAHAQGDAYPRIAEIRELSERMLPGAVLRRHVLWRYSLVWQKPVSSA